ncbi:RNB domain-containing ribonuclease [Candidatus Dependentiae bacterium]|nr:RNB domain-containing ribonuclease [Candidatus Dependentiae bacterium]
MLIEYIDGNTVKLGLVLNTIQTQDKKNQKYKVITGTGKNESVSGKNIIQEISIDVKESEFAEFYRKYIAKVSELSKTIDICLLWETIKNEPVEYSVQDLSSLNFADNSYINISSVFRTLKESPIYFKQINFKFRPKTEEEVVSQIQKNIEKEKNDEENKKNLGLLKKLISLDEEEEIEKSGDYEIIFKSFENFLFCNNHDKIIKMFSEIIDPQKNDIRKNIYDILFRANRISPEADPITLVAGITEEFSDDVKSAVIKLREFDDFTGRTLIKDKNIFTVDDKSTMIIDDAVSIEETESGYSIFVYISDPSVYVDKGGFIDNEAINRVMNIYLPHKVIPMFPLELSAGLSSLIEQTDKPVVTMEIRFDKSFGIISYSVYPGVIRVSKKLSYSEVDTIMNEKKNENQISAQFCILKKITDSLRNERIRNGAVIFNKPEVEVRLYGNEITVTKINKDSPSKLIIAELMIFANHLMSKFCDDNNIPIIYRMQDAPFYDILPEERVFSEYNPVLFRKLLTKYPSSKYGMYRMPHSTIGLDGYTQYTSPVRRYNDFLIIRQLSGFFENKLMNYDHSEMLTMFIDIEKKINKIKMLQSNVKTQWIFEYLKRYQMNELFNGIVIKKIPAGYFVELEDYLVTGFLSTSKQFEPGHKVQIFIDEIYPEKNKLRLKL